MISVKSVSFKDMPKKRWFISPRHRDWFYHIERQLPPSPVLMRWLDHLDPQLSPLIDLFQSQGVLTLPSCAGHYRTDEWCSKAYDNLIKDAETIQKDGLPLIEVETGETFKFKKRDWSLPFNRKQFAQAARGTEGIPEGSLAIATRDNGLIHGLDKAVRQTPCCRLVRHPDRVELRVFGGNPEGQRRAWDLLTKKVQSKIKCGGGDKIDKR